MSGRAVILAVLVYLAALAILPDECPECAAAHTLRNK